MTQSPNNKIRINIGCGQNAVSGWLNIDKSPNAWLAKHRILKTILGTLHILPHSSSLTAYPPDIVVMDIHRKGLPVPDNSAEWIYSSMMIGSMSRSQAMALLAKCHHALKPGGKIRIVTLDLQNVAISWHKKTQAYLEGDRSYFHDLDEQNIALGDCFVRSLNLDLYTRASLGRFQRLFDYPVQYYYDFDSLAFLLSNLGFSAIEKHGHRQSTMPNVNELDIHSNALHVEACK